MDDHNVSATLLGNAISRLPQTGPNGLPWGQVMGALLVVTLCTWIYLPQFDGVSAPFVEYRSSLEPGLLVRLRFATGAPRMIKEGYSKVSHLAALPELFWC